MLQGKTIFYFFIMYYDLIIRLFDCFHNVYIFIKWD